MDATLTETFKEEATHCYKGFKAYQPLNVWWAEQEMMRYTEFRDGNVPAGHEQKRVLEEALKHLPEAVKRVRLRSDTAGYQHELLKYCDQTENKRFGRIEFAIGCDVTAEFKKAVSEVAKEKLIIRIAHGHPSFELLQAARFAIAELARAPSG
jgi:hypothetical protein